MARLYRHEFVVEGKMAFPIDMLRYDHCYPAREIDSTTIAEYVRTYGNIDKHEKVVLNQVTEGKKPYLTNDRWKSFGWEITEFIDSRQI